MVFGLTIFSQTTRALQLTNTIIWFDFNFLILMLIIKP